MSNLETDQLKAHTNDMSNLETSNIVSDQDLNLFFEPDFNKSKKRPHEVSDRKFMMLQTEDVLKEYIILQDKNKKLKGYTNLKKEYLVDYIIKHIDTETGKVFD